MLEEEAEVFTELDTAIDQYVVVGEGGTVKCAECGHKGKKQDVRRHIEAKHVTNTNVFCQLCGKVSATRNGLKRHMKKEH